MSIPKQQFEELVKGFRYRELFNELGWENDYTPVQPLEIGENLFQPEIVADKNGFKIMVCEGAVPDYSTRMKLTHNLKPLFHEHILIFVDKARKEQLWLYRYSIDSRPKRSEIRYNNSQDIERLYQRASGMVFELDEQDNITIIDVVARVKSNLSVNAERVTKRFYSDFKKQHTALIGLIEGIEAEADREWYASVMLNRLMFCYFMQRRGFLDNDLQYLRHKLDESRQKLGDGQFYSFYRSFLRVLFQKGFGTQEHTAEITGMIGKIPYLNGGLFDLHDVERTYPDIDISDDAFEGLFDLFDHYEWHLDARETVAGNEINPDVLGYIFEKYINDRAQMGAYYTQEDITNYIGRNTILPYLLEAVRREYGEPFKEGGSVWQFLKASDDRYIFESVKKGTELDVPDNIQIGVDTDAPDLLSRRKHWNEPADSEYALPTEIWRETIVRRAHYNEVKVRIADGKITDTADFVTNNLDIIAFVQDLVDTIEDPKFIWLFYKQLESITVLDPTCGSGAFLFAALNILEPLYDSLLSRMEDYLSHDYKGILDSRLRHEFEKKLEQMAAPIHPNKSYFIYKSIILNNLFGVDIMREAVETAKLRLFLKLVSTADLDPLQKNYGIEPLPDIDFNIKAGNTLIGFANEAGIENALNFTDLFSGPQYCEEIKSKIALMAKAVGRFKQWQLGQGDHGSDDFREAKQELLGRQEELRVSLNKILRDEHYSSIPEDKWERDYAPFHWVSEFYSIVVGKGGFDVIIGNPPYVEYSKVRDTYALNNYETICCGNLYAFVIERSYAVVKNQGYCGMIIPLSAYCTERMASMQHLQMSKSDYQWISYFAERPSKLFDGVDRNIAITISRSSKEESKLFATAYYKWSSESRAFLFDNVIYKHTHYLDNLNIIPKIGDSIGFSILKKLQYDRKTIGHYSLRSSFNMLYYRSTGGRYWKIITDFQPVFYLNGKCGASSRESHLYFEDADILSAITAVLNSSLYYWYYKISSNARDNNPSDLRRFPIDLQSLGKQMISLLVQHNRALMISYRENSVDRTERRSTGEVKFQQYRPKVAKPIIDQIDTILAEHYGFTDEELDYITNYDIKYRMGFGGDENNDDD